MSDKKKDTKKVNLKSMDVAEEKREKLKEIFPEVFTEKKINFDKLKSVLGDIVETGRERYGMNWAGKADCLRIIQEPSVGTLKPCREESIDFDKTENLFIEGDNLEVLKLLQKSYYGKVKMIYIDPPYNTGKDFIYPDNYSESLDTYRRYTGQVDAEGRKYSTNAETDGRVHTRWINMMYPRLYLARNLLKKDGVIFISINDNEVTNLRKVCDEIFGEENFITTAIWHKVYVPKNSARHFSEDHDYIIVYARNGDSWIPELLPRTKAQDEKYKNIDNDPRGRWRPGPLAARNYYSKGLYSITCPSGRVVEGPPKGLYWKYSEEKFLELDKHGKIWWGENGNNSPAPKLFLAEVKQGRVPQTIWQYKEVGHTQEAKQELLKLVQFSSSGSVFETPKPSRLIKHMLRIATKPDEENIILDFFAGSASTAHGVLSLNSDDRGNRKLIMVQLPEPTGYEDYKTVADIGKERIRRVIKKIKEEEQPKLGSDIDKQDLGFKVFKLDSSNFRLWDGEKPEGEEAIKERLKLHIEHIDPKSTTEDILYELLLKSGFKLTTGIEKLELAGKEVFSIEDGALLICLDEELTKEAIKGIAEKAPAMVICLDRGFKNNDQLKTNAVQIMKVKKVEFRTV